ncbi:hypothetical protein CVN68_20860 [Sphingomonas psychrotolerans]|uniref:Uncharacterized protein n=2 Tax=Sphingomonas psychrotolerans TaxID=1327635 RepID=A0A2K8MJN5_9SPHN|nr:hypothetical protein CVN68_20860 [Sphingomonas psychrotolerans]
MLSGCAALAGPRAADTCKAIAGDRVAQALGSTLVTQELDGQRKHGKEVASTCHYDLANGDFVRITLSSYADPAEADEAFAWLKKKPSNAVLSEKLGVRVLYETGEKEIDALLSPTEQVYARIGHNAGQAKLDKTVIVGSIGVATFKHKGVENAAEKLASVIALAKQ